MTKFNIHRVKCNGEKINNFWNFETSTKTNQEDWFAFQFSGALKNFIKLVIKKYLKSKKINYVDYGAGKGFLLDKFVNDKNILCSGSEFGTDALKILNSKFNNSDNYSGTIDSIMLKKSKNMKILLI